MSRSGSRLLYWIAVSFLVSCGQFDDNPSLVELQAVRRATYLGDISAKGLSSPLKLGNTSSLTNDLTPTCGDTSVGAPDAYFRWTAPFTGRYTFSTANSQFNTILEIRDQGMTNGATLGCNDDVASGLTWSEARVDLVAGQVVLLIVDGAAGASGKFAVNVDGPAIDPDPGCLANELPPNDDGSTDAVALSFPANFFGTTYTHLYVNNNGNVTFNAPLPNYTPFTLTATSPPIIAPFFADVDTRGSGSGTVQYSFGNVQFNGRPTFCVNWVGVGYYNGHTDKLNSFQLLLVDRSDIGPGDFDICMNYDRIEWEAGDASGGSGGLGGTSAGVGYSAGNGDPASFFEFPGSLASGALLDSNFATALTRTNRGGLQRGRHIFEVRNGAAPVGGTISGVVTGPGSAKLADAPVQVCLADGSRCVFVTRTGPGGNYSATNLPEGDYTLTAFPPAGSDLQKRKVGPVHLPLQGALEVNLALDQIIGLPPGTSLSPARPGPNGVPSIYYRDSLALRTTGCPGGSATYEVGNGQDILASGPMTEDPPGQYSASIPPLYPATGPADISIVLTCQDGTQKSVAFDIYIDPSGTVRNPWGEPIEDATVTLLRSDTPEGPFVRVPDGSAIMSPSNRVNPDTTDSHGRFKWDVIAGYYVVRAERDGCTSTSGASFVESPVLTIPPAVLDLDLRLICADTPPPSTRVSASPPPNANGWYNGAVLVQLAASDAESGVQEIVYALSGSQTGGAAIPGEAAEVNITAEGVTTLTWFARDRAGNQEEAHSMEFRLDATPPRVSCSANPGILSPPDHRLVPVQVSVQWEDALSGPGSFVLSSLSSSEPDNQLGDGDTAGDMQGWSVSTADVTGLLRAERAGKGPGRTYTLVYAGRDRADNTATCSLTVTVPHDRR